MSHISEFGYGGSVSVFGASRISGYSRRMLRHLIEIGELPASREGRRSWRIMRDDLYRCLFLRLRRDRLRNDKVISALVGDALPSAVAPSAVAQKIQNSRCLTSADNSTIYSTGSIPVPKTKTLKHGDHAYAHQKEPIEVCP